MIKKLKSIKNNPNIMKYIKNSSWLLLEKVFRFGIGFFVSIWIIRYLGPNDFGILSYIQSILSILSVFVGLGLDGIVLREIVKSTNNRYIIFSTALFLRFVSSLIIILFIYILQHFILEDTQKYYLLFILSLSLVFEAFSILKVSFQEKILSKYEVFSNLLSLTLGAGLKVCFLYSEADLIYFIYAIVFEKFIYATTLFYFYQKIEKRLNFDFDVKIGKNLLQNSWPLILSTLSYIVYTRTDQIMIEHFLGSYEVGIYSAAVRLYELPFIITTIISGTLTPLLYKKYNENKNEFFALTLKILSYMSLLAYIIIAFYWIFGKDIILLLFGEKYLESYNVLIILSVIILIQFVSFLRSSYLILINQQKLFFYIGIVLSLSNIIINYFLIPVYGIMGAIYATLIVRIISLFVYSFFSPTKLYFYIQIKSLIAIKIFNKGIKK